MMRAKPLDSSVSILLLLGLFISLIFTTASSLPTSSMPQHHQEKSPTQLHLQAQVVSSNDDGMPSAPTQKTPLKLLILVEPSPFTYISGYSNRYQALIHSLVSRFDDRVQVITAEVVHPKPPKTWSPSAFAKPTGTNDLPSIPNYYTRGILCPGYDKLLTLSFDWTFVIPRILLRRKNRPDVIHVSTPGFMVFPAVFWARIFQIPLVCSYHTHLPTYIPSYFGKQKWLARLVQGLLWFLIRMTFAHMADLVLVTSPQIQHELVEHGVPSALVWQKGIDTDRFNPRHFNLEMRRRMMGLEESSTSSSGAEDVNKNGAFLMVYVGRLSSEKRLKDLYSILQAMPSSTKLCFVGHGPQEQELKQYFTNTSTIFLGQLQGEELSQAFASADAFVMPSDSETLGFVVLESMASGVPVVGARAGGIPNLIEHEHNGFLVEPGNIPEFVSKLVQLEQNPSLRREMGLRAQREMERWSWEASMVRLRNEQYTMAWRNFSKRPLQRFWRWITRQKRKEYPPWVYPPEQQSATTSTSDEESTYLLSDQGASQYGSATCQ